MQFKKNNFQNRYILIGLIIVSIIFTTAYSREPGEGVFHAMKRFTLSSVSSVQTGASIVMRPVVNGWNFISESIGSREENIVLKEKIAELNRKVETLEFASQENTRLKELLKVSKKKKLKTKLANIIGYSSNDLEKVIIIDKGLNDGLKKRMPVITNKGLIGQIVNITGRAAKVQLITDAKSGVAAETMKVGITGIVEGSDNGKLRMNLVDKNANLKVGDGVFTSGLGSVYPKGIYIGRVKSVSSKPTSLYKDVTIETSTDFNYLKQALVVIAPLPPDISGLK